MYLKRLDVHGFKTFPQRVSFTFPPGITAVVGPNGSGKSNVADAVRWVLGEQSFANLRSKRTEDLVFGGGKGRAPMGFAEVALTIDNSDRLLPLDFDEVTLGRRAYRTGENEYYINRSRVRLRDLLDAIAPLGSSFTLINQGYVDAALALHPEDRQRLIEDAAGIGPYQTRKAESERRLRETETNLVRLHDLVEEQEPQLRALKRQARDAEAVGEVEAELRGLLRRQYAMLIVAADQALQSATEAEQSLRLRLEQARTEQQAAAETLVAARGALREKREALATIREAEADLDRRIAAQMREQAVVDERRAGLVRRQDELVARERALDQAREVGETDLVTLGAEIERAAATLDEQRLVLQERIHATEQLFGARREAEDALASVRTEFTRVSSAVSVLESRVAQLERQHQASEADLISVETDLQRAVERAEQARIRVESGEATLHESETRWRTAEKTLDDAQHTLRAAREAREGANEALAVARRTQGDLEARLESLTRLRNTAEGAYPGVRAAMRWATKEGRDNFALVSSIVETPAELETAVETALGSRLQNIVVERWEDAEAAIATLKRDSAGRATFLPLDTIRESRVGTRYERVLQQPGVLGRAADMIGFDPRYRAVVELLLGRTLIAQDLRAARQALGMLEGGTTLVTLAGEQVAASGALTGGTTRGESGTLRREREFRELPARLAEVQAATTTRAVRLSAAETEVAVRQTATRTAETALRERRSERDRQQIALEGMRRDVHRIADELVTLRKRRERAEAQRATARREADHAVVELRNLGSQRDMLAETMASAETLYMQRRTEAQDEETALRALRDILTVAEAEQRARQDLLARRRRAEATTREESVTLATQIATNATELAASETALAAIRARNEQLAGEADLIRNERMPLQTALGAAETELAALESVERTTMAAAVAHDRRHSEASMMLDRARLAREALEERARADGVELDMLQRVEQGAADETLPDRIATLQNRLRRMGPVNALAPSEYVALQERHTFLSEQLADVRAASATLREAIRELDEMMDSQFDHTFSAVAEEFSASFTQLFGGGTAKMLLVGGESDGQPTRRGIEIVAQPPGKRQLNLQLLSGGERALTAGALLFAILKHQPRPFCILDEVDAALDESNVVRFRDAIKELSQGTQFIIITHNRGTVEAADTLYGITMGEDSGSRVLSLRFVPGEDELVVAKDGD